MKLSFLGQTYTASNPVIDATETQATVIFLGCSSKVKHFNVTQRQQPTAELKFMGRSYIR